MHVLCISSDDLDVGLSSKHQSARMNVLLSLTMAAWVFHPLQLTTPLSKRSAGTHASTVIATFSHGASVT